MLSSIGTIEYFIFVLTTINWLSERSGMTFSSSKTNIYVPRWETSARAPTASKPTIALIKICELIAKYFRIKPHVIFGWNLDWNWVEAKRQVSFIRIENPHLMAHRVAFFSAERFIASLHDVMNQRMENRFYFNIKF